ncbi:hypothetical protein AK830_g7509 [Neonectria ditissima]|uniref:thioredoxin-dependent peroxiredoxin n=1 Tax=Neonectria ditissima TaxID=78410 RepID=A0A0P7BF61_9HYPO|nr:hypothetical protein AK830_g7509 [Neonectria ditissima]
MGPQRTRPSAARCRGPKLPEAYHERRPPWLAAVLRLLQFLKDEFVVGRLGSSAGTQFHGWQAPGAGNQVTPYLLAVATATAPRFALRRVAPPPFALSLSRFLSPSRSLFPRAQPRPLFIFTSPFSPLLNSSHGCPVTASTACDSPRAYISKGTSKHVISRRFPTTPRRIRVAHRIAVAVASRTFCPPLPEKPPIHNPIMPVELRKRKAREPPAPPPVTKKAAPKATKAKPAAAAKVKAPKPAPSKKAAAKVEKVAEESKDDVTEDEEKEEPKEEEPKEEEPKEEEPKEEEPKEEPKKAKKAGKVEVGDIIDLESFGAEIETNDGEKTTLKKLVDESGSGVVLFTYPKASTPGCTKQVCFFRDAFEPLTAGGLAIYGLSKDSPKANTTFKEKQKLPYPLLCDPKQTLITAIGLKKAPNGTQRGVFVVDKDGKVLVAEAGSPQGTVDTVTALVKELADK